MLSKYFENKKKLRLQVMENKVPTLSDAELKTWYQYADCDGETNLLFALDKELTKRGFKHRVDY